MKENKYYTKKGYVSNSSLNILVKSPKKFKLFLDGLLEDTTTKYLEFGQLVHMYILEKHIFDDTVVVLDYVSPRSAQQKQFCEDFLEEKKKIKVAKALVKAYKNNYKTKEKEEDILKKAEKLRTDCKSYLKYLELSKDKQVITPKIFEKIKEIGENTKKHKAASRLLYDDSSFIANDLVIKYNEFPIYWNIYDIKCKSLLDRLIIDKENRVVTIIDVKTTSDITNFKDSFDKYNYGRQLQFYGAALTYGEGFGHIPFSHEQWKIEFKIVAIDTVTTEVKVFDIEESQVMSLELRELLKRANWHITNDKWDYSMEYYLGNGEEKL